MFIIAGLLICSAFAASTPGGKLGIAVNPDGALSFLRVNSSGALLLAAVGPGVSPVPPGQTGVALDPDGHVAFLHVDSSGGLLTSGGAVAGPITTSGLTMTTARMLGRTTAGTGAIEEMTAANVKTFLSLNLVENTALSTWGGSSSITTTGTLTSGATGAGFTLALGTSTLTGILPAANGGTANGFTAFTGPTTSTKTFTLPNASATILTDNAVVTGAQGGTGVANTGKTITLAGNLVTTGAFNTTFAQAATTTVTLPATSSTMARTDAAQTFTGVQTFSSAPVATTGIYGATVTGTGGSSYGAALPITIYVKSVTVNTAGSPSDIATIIVPAGFTRWRLVGIAASTTSSTIIAETAAGTLATANFAAYSAAGGGGSQILNAVVGPTAATPEAAVGWTAFNSSAAFTAGTIYVRQTIDSVNAGTCSFYITLYPLP